jgi:hypothetical protein
MINFWPMSGEINDKLLINVRRDKFYLPLHWSKVYHLSPFTVIKSLSFISPYIDQKFIIYLINVREINDKLLINLRGDKWKLLINVRRDKWKLLINVKGDKWKLLINVREINDKLTINVREINDKHLKLDLIQLRCIL